MQPEIPAPPVIPADEKIPSPDQKIPLFEFPLGPEPPPISVQPQEPEKRDYSETYKWLQPEIPAPPVIPVDQGKQVRPNVKKVGETPLTEDQKARIEGGKGVQPIDPKIQRIREIPLTSEQIEERKSRKPPQPKPLKDLPQVSDPKAIQNWVKATREQGEKADPIDKAAKTFENATLTDLSIVREYFDLQNRGKEVQEYKDNIGFGNWRDQLEEVKNPSTPTEEATFIGPKQELDLPPEPSLDVPELRPAKPLTEKQINEGRRLNREFQANKIFEESMLPDITSKQQGPRYRTGTFEENRSNFEKFGDTIGAAKDGLRTKAEDFFEWSTGHRDPARVALDTAKDATSGIREKIQGAAQKVGGALSSAKEKIFGSPTQPIEENYEPLIKEAQMRVNNLRDEKETLTINNMRERDPAAKRANAKKIEKISIEYDKAYNLLKQIETQKTLEIQEAKPSLFKNQNYIDDLKSRRDELAKSKGYVPNFADSLSLGNAEKGYAMRALGNAEKGYVPNFSRDQSRTSYDYSRTSSNKRNSDYSKALKNLDYSKKIRGDTSYDYSKSFDSSSNSDYSKSWTSHTLNAPHGMHWGDLNREGSIANFVAMFKPTPVDPLNLESHKKWWRKKMGGPSDADIEGALSSSLGYDAGDTKQIPNFVYNDKEKLVEPEFINDTRIRGLGTPMVNTEGTLAMSPAIVPPPRTLAFDKYLPNFANKFDMPVGDAQEMLLKAPKHKNFAAGGALPQVRKVPNFFKADKSLDAAGSATAPPITIDNLPGLQEAAQSFGETVSQLGEKINLLSSAFSQGIKSTLDTNVNVNGLTQKFEELKTQITTNIEKYVNDQINKKGSGGNNSIIGNMKDLGKSGPTNT